ncbi:pyridoxamine 5'-phosphate oxidase family protein [Kiloniella laminariae]|uniref:Pyridoxamine 5'-phosphate oxidase family protein n=1 Tax=Kiloniella laminariae TaxID=454162 RepID=A0ABT4LMZ5_9PROT|nr:pyridoxamine 5'-phosphate oxidase family protein [Kiloniella laminariae]MCZ4281322.1 pyridoxamine 5'-phosphate oxidase family protein [Kiloniella laminariae]
MSYLIKNETELRALYGEKSPRADKKVLTRLDKHCRSFIAHSPFLTLATASPELGADCSPKGDAPGFVRVLNDQQLAIPDRPGNNRIDSAVNILANPQVGVLFIIPGVKETLRVNGDAVISVEPELLETMVVNGKKPRSAIVITIREAYIHCAKSLMRSDLWNPEKHLDRKELASMGQILADHMKDGLDSAAYDAEMDSRYRASLY